MKHITKSISIVLALLMLTSVFAVAPITASAGTNGDFDYELREDGTIMITGYSGTESDVVFPSKIDGKTVTGIRALKGNKGMIESVTIPESVTFFAFAFENCKNLKKATLSDGITQVAPGGFMNCTALKTVVIPDSVTVIAENAFTGCKNLESVTIPNKVESINDWAFSECTSLTSIKIPESVKEIRQSAFYGCTNLTDIEIPETDIFIYRSAFQNTGWYNSQDDGVVYLGSIAYDYKGKIPSEVTIKDGTKTIGVGLFYDDNNLTSITLPDGLTTIKEDAFIGCKNLKTITIPESVTTIEKHAVGYYMQEVIEIEYTETGESQGSTTDYWNLEGFTIAGYGSSAAEAYAKSNNSNFYNEETKQTTYASPQLRISEVSLKVGMTSKIEIINTNGKDVSYKSSNTKVATVQDGTVTAQGKGTAKITVTVGGKNLTYTVKVVGSATDSTTTPAPKLKNSSVSLKAGKTSTIVVQNKGNNKVTYKSLNAKVATVKNGKVTALKKGKSNITVTVGKTKLTYKVSVTTSPKLSKKSVSVKKGKPVTVKIKGKASGVNNKYTNTKYAKIKSKRSATKLKIKGLKKGKTTLKIKVNGVALKLKVKVK